MENELQAEVERLRAEVEAYRQQELLSLREALAAMTAERDHYKAEAYRNADLGRQIHADSQVELAKLRTELDLQAQTDRAIRNASIRRQPNN